MEKTRVINRAVKQAAMAVSLSLALAGACKTEPPLRCSSGNPAMCVPEGDVDGLIGSLKDLSAWDRSIHLLAKAGPAAVDDLVDALSDGDWRIRAGSARALGKINHPDSISGLISALYYEDHGNQVDSGGNVEVVAALTSLGHSAVPDLIEALKDDNINVRDRAAYTLGEIKDPTAICALMAAVNDENHYVRQSVIRALGNFRNTISAQAIINTFIDKEYFVLASGPDAPPGRFIDITASDRQLLWDAASALDGMKEALTPEQAAIAQKAKSLALSYSDMTWLL